MECVIRGGEKGTTMGEIMEAYTVKEARGASRAVVDRSVVELAAHKVVKKERESGDGEEDGEAGGVSKVRVKMTEEMRKEYRAGFES
jgi:hypothetical protein